MATALPFEVFLTPNPDATKRSALRDATNELRALGVDDEVVFIGSADEAIAWLEADEPCVSSG